MALKKFPKKLADTKKQTVYDSPVAEQAYDAPKQDLDAHVNQNFNAPDEEFVTSEKVQPYTDLNFIALDKIDDYIEQKWNEKLKTLTPPAQTQANVVTHEINTKKVVSDDDLPEYRNWEERDRIYVLCTGYSSISQGIKDRHKKNSPLMYKGRSLRYSTSQASFFMDKQVGDVLLTYLSIEDGKLFVPKENTHLQKFLAIHPDNGIIFKEFNSKQESQAIYDAQQTKVEAHILAKQIDTGTLIAASMLMIKNYEETMDLTTVKRYLYTEIENNPKLFIKLATDPNLKLKSIGKIAVFRGLLQYANYKFLDEKDHVICEVNRNENEYDSLASYFLSTEGRGLYQYLLNKIEN